MKKLRFFILSIKNNLRGMVGVVVTLCVITAFTFVCAAFLGRVLLVSMRDGRVGDDSLAFLAFIVLVCVYAAANTVYLYGVYLKKSDKRIRLFFSLGAGRRDVALYLVAENALIFLAGLFVGVGLDYALHSAVQMLGGHAYLTGPVFGVGVAAAFAAPAAALTVVLSVKLRFLSPSRRKREERV